ncbi:MAG: restriction endonuclease [Planctomycetota bacterium]
MRHAVPDRRSGGTREVDVWIETQVAGHLPLTIHGSCKDYGRPLDLGEIDAFQGELDSTGANVGVIYSSRGFSRRAVEKAESIGVSCCHLLDGAPPPTPTALRWTQHCFRQNRVRVDILTATAKMRALKTNAELFGLQANVEGMPVTLAEHAERLFRELQRKSYEAARDALSAPQHFAVDLTRHEEGSEPELVVRLTGVWRYYEARIEAFRVDGVYRANDGRIFGAITGPAVDTQGVEPGPGWIELDAPPERVGMAWFFLSNGIGEYLRGPDLVRWPETSA